MVNPHKKFTINNITQELNEINPEISLSHHRPFPNLNLLSHYEFKKRPLKILPNGDIEGGFAKMLTSLIDFSFIRSLVADCYSIKAPSCYDPPSIFLTDLFRYMDGFQNMSQFLKVLRDEKRGAAYRDYAGFSDRIPCEGTFSNFRARLGESHYMDIFHVLVDIFHRLQMITFNILARDGTLYPTWARYKGCTYFCEQCEDIKVENISEKVKNRILYRLKKVTENNLGSEIRVYAPCPSERFPEKDKKGKEIKRPRVELFACKLAFSDGDIPLEQRNTAILFGVNEELERQGLCIQTLRTNVTDVNPDDGSLTISHSGYASDHLFSGHHVRVRVVTIGVGFIRAFYDLYFLVDTALSQQAREGDRAYLAGRNLHGDVADLFGDNGLDGRTRGTDTHQA